MPYGRYRSRSFYRRQYGIRSRAFRRYRRRGLRARNRYAQGVLIKNVAQNLMPMRKVVKLSYGGIWPISVTAGTWGQNRFMVNSLFSPDLSSPTSQPRGFDEMAALYDNYCVLGVKATARIYAESFSGWLVGSYVSDQSTLPVANRS